jgi:hypothetical protein
MLITRRKLAGMFAGLAGLGAYAATSPRAGAQTSSGMFVPGTPSATPVVQDPPELSAPIVVSLFSHIGPDKLPFSELDAVATALTIQVSRDFAPIWGINAVVEAVLDKQMSNPSDWWLEVQESPSSIGHWGSHASGKIAPMAIVAYQPSAGWSRFASHECLEMLVNPYRRAFYLLPSLSLGQGDVLYPVEICDPVSTDGQEYSINGLSVSDFVTPRYFDLDPIPVSGVKYSFRGHASGPLGVAAGAYQNWKPQNSTEIWSATQCQSGLKPCKLQEGQNDFCPC